MKKNNKGFTLVEVIVATAIVAIVALGVTSLMANSTRTYRYVNTHINLQYDYQLTSQQMQEYILDTNAGIAWDYDSATTVGILSLVSVDRADYANAADDVYTLHQYQVVGNQLLYGTATSNPGNPGDLLTVTPNLPVNDDVSHIIAKGSKPTTVTVSTITSGADGSEVIVSDSYDRISELELEIHLHKNDRDYHGNQIIALRNQPVYVNGTLSELLADIETDIKPVV